MRARRILVAVAAAAAVGAVPAAASAAGGVFVQTDAVTGNQIAVYDRAPDGTLTAAATYATGGLGGALEGSKVDHLASQSSLVYDRADGVLLAVNAGSNSVSVFGVFGNRLALRQVISSGGSFPVSIAVRDGLVYVLDAGEGGLLAGFRVQGGRLAPISGSSRALGLNPSATPQFVNTPGEVGFAPAGTQLLVTTKANGNAVDVFAVHTDGRLGNTPTVNTLPGAVPFSFVFGHAGELLLTEAGTSALASFALREDGTLAQQDVVGTGQAATCWVAELAGRYYVSNAGSGNVTGFSELAAGQLLAPIGNTVTAGGTVDAASAGRYLYVQAGAEGVVDEFALAAGGALSPIGSVTVPGAAGGEGIVAQ